MNPVSILIIEDDEIVARTIERCLRGDAYQVRTAGNGVEGLAMARREAPDLVILDVIMPGMDGYAVCREMRLDPTLEQIPILFLTTKTKDEEMIAVMSVGADDYLGKPFDVDDLTLRIRAMLRRTRQMHADHEALAAQPMSASSEVKTVPVRKSDRRAVAIGPYSLDTHTYEFSSPKSGRFRLTPVQYDLLFHLMTHPGKVFSPAQLLNEVWHYPSDAGSPDLVRAHIKNLHERIESDPRDPQFIQVVPGRGYTVQASK